MRGLAKIGKPLHEFSELKRKILHFMQKRQRRRWKSVKYTKITISEDDRCDPEQDLIVYLTSIISWFKLQAAWKALKTDEIKN